MAFIRKYKRNGRIYLAEVENQWKDGKCKQKFIRYVGVDPDSDREFFPSCNQELSIDGVKRHGSVLVLDYIARQLGLHKLLGEHFAPILALVYCHCHDYKSVKDMNRWLKTVDLYNILGVEKITEKQLHEGISALDDMCLRAIEKSVFETMKAKFNDSCEGVVYDVTNTYLRGGASTLTKLAQKGRDKEGVRGRKLIQVGLAMTAEKRLPIFHQVHSGNVSDFKMFEEAIEDLNRFNVDRGIIVYDRGMHANSSILRLANTRWKLIGGVPLHKSMKDFITNTDFEKFENCRYRHQQGDSTFYAKAFQYQMGNVKGRLLIILNPKKKVMLKEERLNKILTARQSGKNIPKNLAQFFKINGDINHHAIKRKERYDGISVLFTTGKIPVGDAIRTYFDKDLIEKSFRTLKSVIGIRPIRHWLEGKVRGHIFICYLSLVLLTTLRLLLDEKGKKCVQGLSPEAVLKELEEVYIIEYSKKSNAKIPEKSFQKVITLSNLQKEIFLTVMPHYRS